MEICKVGINIFNRMTGIVTRGAIRYGPEHAARLCKKRTTYFYKYSVVP